MNEIIRIEKSNDSIDLYVAEYPQTSYVVNQLELRLEGISIIQFLKEETSSKCIMFSPDDLEELKEVLKQVDYSLRQARIITNWLYERCDNYTVEDVYFILNHANENLDKWNR